MTPTLNPLLPALQAQILRMGGRVVEMVERAIRALCEGDEALARQTITLDRRVNQDEIEIDAAVARLIRAGSLDEIGARLVMASTKMVVDLERVADLAVDVCELVLAMEETGIPGDLDELRRISTVVVEMLNAALEAFELGDAVKAQQVIDRDDELDEAYRAFFANLLERGGKLRVYIPEQNIAKLLERMGDHATNLAEQAIFLANGRDVRHRGKRVE